MNEAELNKEHIKHQKSNVFQYIIIVLYGVLIFSLILFYRTQNQRTNYLNAFNDIHKLKARLQSDSLNIKGEIEIAELFESIKITGTIKGLVPGSKHSLHVYEYIDSLLDTDIPIKLNKQINLFNYNNILPNCNMKDNDIIVNSDYYGHLADIIVDEKGIANINNYKQLRIQALAGRALGLTNSVSDCNTITKGYDLVDNILVYGTLTITKPKILNSDDYNHYFLKYDIK